MIFDGRDGGSPRRLWEAKLREPVFKDNKVVGSILDGALYYDRIAKVRVRRTLHQT